MSTITDNQRRELNDLAQRPDSEIDTSDLPEQTDFTGGVRGRFNRPAPRPVTLDIDADILSADAETRPLAFVRGRALRDERTLLREAQEHGRAAGMRQAATNLNPPDPPGRHDHRRGHRSQCCRCSRPAPRGGLTG